MESRYKEWWWFKSSSDAYVTNLGIGTEQELFEQILSVVF